MIDVTKYGIASKIDKKINDIIFNINPMPPQSNEVPLKILLFHVSPIPINANPANPKVIIPINAVLRFLR